MKCQGIHVILNKKTEKHTYETCNEEIGHDGHKIQSSDFINGHLTYCWNCDEFVSHRRDNLQILEGI